MKSVALKKLQARAARPKPGGKMRWLVEHLNKPKVYVPTGFNRLDAFVDGLYPENIFIIAGRPGSGKTTMDMNIIHSMKDQRHLVFPTENSRERWMEKFLSLFSGIPDKEIRQHQPDTVKKLLPIIEELGERPIRVVTSYHPTFDAIRTHIEEFRPDVLHFDYFQNIYLDPAMKGYRGYTEAVEQFHAISIEYNIPVVLGSQLARPPKDRQDDRPRMSDLKETGKLEEAAKTVLLMYRNGNQLESIIEKNRDGETGTLMWSGDWATNKLEESI